MAYRLLNGSRPRVSFTLAAVGYKYPGYHDSVALLQYMESGDTRKSDALKSKFTTRPYDLTSYEGEAEKHELVLSPDSEDGQDPGDTQPASMESRWRGKRCEQFFSA
jgi:hypothetical protein